MLTKKFKTLALPAFVAAALTSTSAYAIDTINVAVAANFTATMNALIAAFRLVYPTANVTFTSNSSATLQSQIINHTRVYDLFLSADQTRPLQLATTYPTLVNGSPFKYAVGELELWSPTVNIKSGLPATLNRNLVLANPNAAPYGTAAAEVLSAAPWSIPWTPGVAYPPAGTPFVFTRSNISATYSAVKNGTFPYGFIAQSQICRLVGGVKKFNSGFHHTYRWNAAPTHSRIEQYAIRLANPARTRAQTTVLTNFVNFMRTNTVGKNIVKSYCYALS